MKQFSLMLVPDSGPVQSFRVHQSWLIAAAIFALLLTSFGAWGIYSIYQAKTLAYHLDTSERILRMVHQQQHDAHVEMQAKMDEEHQKIALYARNLGELKARVLRLDALGEHLVKVSKMDKNSFDFDVKPAMGGPRVAAIPLESLGLEDRMASMNATLTHLDVQLVAIDMLLQGEREEKVARPHAWPSEGGWLSSPYGVREDPFSGGEAFHRGVDIANRFGAPVVSASRGVVVFSGKMEGYGYMIEVEHGYGYRTRYGHMSSSLVKVGDEVKDNQLLGRVGSSGRSTGPHLHFEVLHFGEQVDPAPFLPRA